ncbi:hypothetical protein BKI52_21560 [marine bacterium AO1-C]|nr:hypothetical protein BKI52_21560 [marine bacterium AO1-C]
MKFLLSYLKQFWREAGNLGYLFITCAWLALMMGVYYTIIKSYPLPYQVLFQAFTYLGAVLLGMLAQKLFYKQSIKESSRFWVLIAITICVLLIRKGFTYHRVWIKTQVSFSLQYWAEQLTIYGFRILTFVLPVYLIWRLYDQQKEPLYGFSVKTFHPKPYIILLLLIAPFIFWASTTAGFLAQYPIYKANFAAAYLKVPSWVTAAVFELFYGIDFVFVELFFRGFLIILVGRYFGPQVVILAASIYCLFHLGKPIGETISSFFGGLLLGVFSYYSRSIYGGIMLHLGVAYMMELFAFLQKT